MSRLARNLLLFLFILLFLAMVFPAPLQFAGMILFGWVMFIQRVIPAVKINPSSLLTMLVCLAGVLALGQWLGGYLMREISRTSGMERVWRFRWTLLATGAIVLSFVAGTAAVGIAHQSAWLAREDGPWFHYRRQPIFCQVTLKQIGNGLQRYASAHDGQLPDDLRALVDEYVDERELSCPVSEESTGHTAPYVYHGKGLRLPLPAEVIVVCEPLMYHRGEAVFVLFADGETKRLSPVDVDLAMRRSEQLLAEHTPPTN
jgi:hypothetical protein